MPNAITLPAEQRGAIPHFDQYLGEWAMREENVLALWQFAGKLNINLHLAGPRAQEAMAAGGDVDYRVDSNVAVIGLAGSLMKQTSSLSSGTSTVMVRKKIRAAVRNPDVHGILLLIDSPGGTVAGTFELADDIAAAAKQKPLWSYCEDLCASAAYWIGSQAERVYANTTAIVGSIGTYAVVHDYSAAAAKEGIKVHVVKAGDMKGAGTPGTEITAEQLADWQARVNELNEFFIAGVASGRRMSPDQARKLADGRVYVGTAAKNAGLIDGVQTLDQTFSQFLSHIQSRRKKTMDASQTLEQNTLLPANTAAPQQTAPPAPAKPAAATAAEIEAACPGADAAWCFGQLKAGATIEAARSAWMAELNSRLTKSQTELAEAKKAPPAPAATTKPKLSGVDPTPPSSGRQATEEEASDPIAAWDAAVADLMTERKLTKAQATRELVISNSALHQQYIAAYTRVNGPKVDRRNSAA